MQARPLEASRDSAVIDAREPVELLLRDLRTGPDRPLGPRGRPAARGVRPQRDRAPAGAPLAARAREPVHASAGAAPLGRRARSPSRPGRPSLGIAIVAVIVLNAGVRVRPGAPGRARGRGARAATCRSEATVRPGRRARRRSRRARSSPATCCCVAEGDRDLRPTRGCSRATLEVDLSTLTGESQPVFRSAELARHDRAAARGARPRVQRHERASAARRRALVFATGMHTELGRIAALSERVEVEPSPLERQVRRVAWLIAARRGRRRRSRSCRSAGSAPACRSTTRSVRDRPDRRERPGGAAADDHARARRRRARSSRAAARSSSGCRRSRRSARPPSSAPTRPAR